MTPREAGAALAQRDNVRDTLAPGTTKIYRGVAQELYRDRVLCIQWLVNTDPATADTLALTVVQRGNFGSEQPVKFHLPPGGGGRFRVRGPVELVAVVGALGGDGGILDIGYLDDGAVEPCPTFDVSGVRLGAALNAGVFGDVGWCPPERYLLQIWTPSNGVEARFVDAAGTEIVRWIPPNPPTAPVIHPPRFKLQTRSPGLVGDDRVFIATWR